MSEEIGCLDSALYGMQNSTVVAAVESSDDELLRPDPLILWGWDSDNFDLFFWHSHAVMAPILAGNPQDCEELKFLILEHLSAEAKFAFTSLRKYWHWRSTCWSTLQAARAASSGRSEVGDLSGCLSARVIA